MTIALLAILVAGSLRFSRAEKRIWGTATTPFSFIVYPFLFVLAIAVVIGPQKGFLPIHAASLVVAGAYFLLIALASVLASHWTGAAEPKASPAPHQDSRGYQSPGAATGSVEYLVVGAILLGLFATTLTGGAGAPDLEKGELAIGGLKGHAMDAGVAYMVVALSQRGDATWVRLPFIALMLWILGVNQVKYLILIPLAGAALYRWSTGSLATWKLVVIGTTVPLLVMIAVYTYFGAGSASAGGGVSLELVRLLFDHMVGYVLAGVIGLDQLIARGHVDWLDLDGLEYVFAPVVNTVRFLTSRGTYFNVVNSLYLDIDTGGMMDSNVFSLPGSIAFRGGWVLASLVSLAFGLVSYWIWAWWRSSRGALACAAGTFWMGTLLFTWHDPFFMHLGTLEIFAFLWLRGALATRQVLGKSRTVPA